MFTNLHDVDITSPLGFILDDSFVVAMALAWPQIKRLAIRAMYPTWGHFGPSTTALFSLARNCPLLYHLTMHVDFTRVHKPTSRPARVVQTALVAANFADSPIESPVQTARLLSSIFPALSSVRGSLGLHEEKWAEVERLVPEYAAIRADEREYGASARGPGSQLDPN
ncbi:hypothetical protein C8R44DRAFT_881909 [Mycena epipterygia]|nr:hypothetical protein C8R44DRAFT_881909 [Mycena epipterygia]